MTALSPAAQAVLTAQAKARCLFEWDHVNDPPCHPSDADWNGCFQCIDRRGLAAALRAAADQVVPSNALYARSCCEFVGEQCRAQLLAIADELEAPNSLPLPTNLKEQALALIDDCTDPESDYLDDNALSIIRRALEQLDD